jgi:helix-turn-helix protein
MGHSESPGKSAGVSATSGNSPLFTLKQAAPYGRAAYSPAEFAATCGRHPSWAYRLLYGGKIHAITQLGRILIPAAELERVLSLAQPYDPKPKPKPETEQQDRGRAL